MPLSARHLIVSALLVALLSGCGKKDSETSAADSEAQATPESPAPDSSSTTAEAASNPITAPLTTADIDRWEKGIAGELQAVQAAGAKLKTASTGEDTLNAMMGVQEMNTVAAGAGAAGLEQERYKFVRSNLSAVVGYLTPWLGGIDTTMLTPAQRDEMRQGNEAQLQRMQAEVPAEVIAGLRPRAVELRKKDLELTGARLKGAGMQ